MKYLIAIPLFFLFSFQLAAKNPLSLISLSDTSEVDKAVALTDKVIEEGRTIESLEEALAVTLPVGISKKIGNTENIIVLETMKFTPEGATVTAYMATEFPESGKKIGFKGKDINFAPGGFTKGARLELLENVDIPIGEKTNLVIKGDEQNTFVEWDCNGYKAMGLQGAVEFSRDMLIPEDANGNTIQDTDKKVTSNFETQLEGWDDLLIEVSMSPFHHKALEGFSFTVNNAVFDFSNLANVPSMTFPENYDSPDFIEGNQKMWKGFFLKDLVVRLPKNLSKEGEQRASIEAHNMIIDKLGFSGTFAAKNILPKEDGHIGKWPFSVDEISAGFIKNQMTACGFKGSIGIPHLSDTATLNYEATIDPANQYKFLVETTDTLSMDMWAAKLRLDPNSYVDIRVVQGEFYPKAVLNGNLSVKAKKTELAGIDFEELTLKSEAPYVKVKTFSFGTESSKQKLGKYPISITNIKMVNDEERTGLKFDLKLNLMKESDGGFAGETGLTLYAKAFEKNQRQKWKFDGVEVSKIAIDIDAGAFKLNGSAEWFKEAPVYGDGFSGNLKATFKALGEVKATALFGNLNGMRYFYADALVNLNKGIPIFTGVNLYGMGGGVYHHMRQLGWDEKPSGTIGKTASGIVYKPDKTTKFGFKATVNIGGANKSAFNSDLTYEMAFNNHGGVDRIVFNGNGYFMTPVDKENKEELKKIVEKCKEIAKNKDPNTQANKDVAKSQFYAFLNLDFDFRNDVMHGNFGAYINMEGGVLTGTGPQGKAGEAVMHFAKDDWYIHIGTPDNRIGIKALKFAELNAYFMTGTNIPSSPPPPAKVSEILGGIDLDYMKNENALGTGKGIAFGAALQFNTGQTPKDIKLFYAKIDAGMGFDVMMKNYGNVSCSGRAEPLGINGWYANGQVWAYLEGAIGIRVKLKRMKWLNGDYEILKVGAAAVLQAKLPNPFWMHGVIGGRYSILGGLVSGNCRFDLTIGEECQIENGGSPVQGIQVIAEATPNDGETDVNVFNAAQAVFNMPIDKVFELEDIDGNNLAFKIQLDHFYVKDNGKIIQGDLEWNAEKDVVAFNSFEILPPKKKLSLEVQVSFKEKKNGSWKILMDNGKKVTESLKTTFTTGEAPKYIPMSNVAYSYPLPMMFNYYQNETNIGYIQLKKGQEYLFKPGSEWKQIGRFTDKNGSKHEFSFSYNVAQKKVDFKGPANLANNTIYSFELVNVPAQEQIKVDKNVVAKVEKKELKLKGQEGEGSTIEIKTKDAEGTLNILEEKAIFSTYFRTSRYNTLGEKIAAMQVRIYYNKFIFPRVQHLYIYYYGNELFSDEEMNANNNNNLIQFIAHKDNKWFKNVPNQLVYNQYPFYNLKIKNRNIDMYGVPPLKAVSIHQSPNTAKLTIEDVKYEISNTNSNYVAFKYFITSPMYYDFTDILGQAAYKYSNASSVPSRVKYLLTHNFEAIYKGYYNVNIQYILPGKNNINSEHKIKFYNPVGL